MVKAREKLVTVMVLADSAVGAASVVVPVKFAVAAPVPPVVTARIWSLFV